jgi:hypothetical protein
LTRRDGSERLVPSHSFPQKEVADVPEPKDVIIGILGASGALAGLLLVFSGFVFAQAASFPENTPDAVIARYTRAGRLALWPFLGSLIITILAVVWLLHPLPCVFWACTVMFVLAVIYIGVYGILVAYRYL